MHAFIHSFIPIVFIPTLILNQWDGWGSVHLTRGTCLPAPCGMFVFPSFLQHCLFFSALTPMPFVVETVWADGRGSVYLTGGTGPSGRACQPSVRCVFFLPFCLQQQPFGFFLFRLLFFSCDLAAVCLDRFIHVYIHTYIACS